MPDLVARLAGLHATLTARASLQDSLRGLSGRLDLVLQQMELRAAPAPAPLGRPGKGKQGARVARKYVEGESEEEQGGMDVDIEEGSDAGSVEDVELGGESDEESSDEEEDEEEGRELDDDDDDEDDEGDDGTKLNGFIDDEAEESDEGYSDDESD